MSILNAAPLTTNNPKSCKDYESAHIYNIPAGHPLYRLELDSNHNGVACEKGGLPHLPLPSHSASVKPSASASASTSAKPSISVSVKPSTSASAPSSPLASSSTEAGVLAKQPAVADSAAALPLTGSTAATGLGVSGALLIAAGVTGIMWSRRRRRIEFTAGE